MTVNEELLKNYREYPGGNWRWIANAVMDYLLALGLERNHMVVDVGCGPLRIGQHLITYLDPGCYVGIEPEEIMLQAGITNELGPGLLNRQCPMFYAEPVGNRSLLADWALGWDVFNHAAPHILRTALDCVRGKWLMNIHLGDSNFTLPADGTGWSYRFAVTRTSVYTPETFEGIVREAGYTQRVVDKRDSGWPGYPFTVVLLEPQVS